MTETWTPLFKHMGPGPHESGSLQQAHAGGGSSATISSDPSRMGGSGKINHELWASDPPAYRHGRALNTTYDFQGWEDINVRFAVFWQAKFEGHDLVREAAMNVLDGKDPLDNHSVNHISEYNIWTEPRLGTHSPSDYSNDDLFEDVAGAGQWMADGLRQGGPGETLFRGAEVPRDTLRDLTVGSEIDLGPSSTSHDPEKAAAYIDASHLDGGTTAHAGVMIRFPSHTKRFDFREVADDRWQEQVLAGKFRITAVTPSPGTIAGEDFPEVEYLIDLEPVTQP